MIISINQPSYLPWLGYFDRIIKSDLHIILDNVQLEKNSMTNRNKARTNNGWTWLSIPVLTKGLFGNLVLKNVEIDKTQNWRKKHFGTLLSTYGKSAYFNEYRDWFSEFYKEDWKTLGPLLEKSTNFLLQSIGIDTPMEKASDIIATGKKSDYILNLCKEVNATVYLSGPFGRDYLELDRFESAGIEVRFHDYAHPTYNQLHGEFMPYMSIVDLLFNEGSKSLEIIINASK
jgi:hypothetical protein